MGFDVERDPDASKIRNIQELKDVVKIPVLGEIAAGEPLSAIENIDEYRYRTTEGLPSGELFYLQAKGDSMTPMMVHQEVMFCVGSKKMWRMEKSLQYWLMEILKPF